MSPLRSSEEAALFFEVQPRTEIGQKFVELAEQHAEEVAARAAEHDREGSFPVEAIEAMKSTGFLTAPMPQEYGGLWPSSLHNPMGGANPPARGDGSIPIPAKNHLT